MNQQQLNDLIEKVSKGTATDEELGQYNAYLNRLAPGDTPWAEQQLGEPDSIRKEIWDRISGEMQPGKVRKLYTWKRYAVAASVLLAIGAGTYWYVHQKQAGQQSAQNNKVDRTPGGNKAILTLSNGQQIVLNGKQGQIASQAGKQVLVNAKGEITYTGQANSTEIIYNTLTVPIGNTREITLPDGTEVSLDAGSSITYPVVFGKDRKVAITGQAYFKVQHDPAHPFYTTVKGLTIADIGTEFNINAYDDEPSVKTTLVAGSVKVNETLLKPGEQANARGNNITIKAADLQSVTAWKNNEFYFRSQSLKTSMRQIARWYNVSINYNNVDDRLRIFVDVSRAINLSVVLKAIENTGKVKCSFDGHTITLSQPN